MENQAQSDSQGPDRLIRYAAIAVIAVVVLLIVYSVVNSRRAGNEESSWPPYTPDELTTTPSSLQYKDLSTGSGAAAQAGDVVSVHYTGWLTDGTKFDSSLDRGRPFEFALGAGDVIQGWDEGVAGMQLGAKRILVIPANLAYGEGGAGGGLIPPGATLVFEVELIEIK